jgi:hypothetical protein
MEKVLCPKASSENDSKENRGEADEGVPYVRFENPTGGRGER